MSDTGPNSGANGTKRAPAKRNNANVSNPTSEIGLTGLKRGVGRSGVYEEFLRELTGERGVRVLKEMRDNDPTVGAILFAIDKLIRQVKWTVEQGEATEEDALFLEDCMHDMSHTWADFVSEVLSMLPFGWAYFEVVYKKRAGPQANPKSKHDDGRVGWRKFSIRAQETLADWEWDEAGGIQGMWQQAEPANDRVFLPIEKCLHFRTGSEKGNPQGRSFLRNAYRPWYFKKRIEEIEAVGVERDLAGFPVMHVDPRILDPNAPPEYKALAAAYADIVVNIRRDQQEGLLIPSVYDDQGHELYRLELLSSGGARQFDTNGIIQRWDQRIAMTVLADFILLGHETVGSFALSSDKTDLFAVALGAVLESVCAVLNNYAVPRLWALNGMNLDVIPQIKYSDVEGQPLDEVSNYISALAGAGMELFPSPELEDHLLDLAGLPKKSDEQKALEAMPGQEQGGQELGTGVASQGQVDQTDQQIEQQPIPS